MSEKKLGICVSFGRTGGELMVPPSREPIRTFNLIWNRTEGLVAAFGQKIEKGTWVLFTLSTQTAFLHFVNRKLADKLWITDSRRDTLVQIMDIQVMAFVRSFRRYNDYYHIGMDELLGWVLLSDDPFVKRIVSQEHLAAELAVVFREDCVRGFNWVAIAVNERFQDGNDCYRKLDGLPRFMEDIASAHYFSREDKFVKRRQLRNPLYPLFVADYGDKPTTRKMLVKEYALGLHYGFEKDYERDINSAGISLNCLVVFKGPKAALVYNKQFLIGVIRTCDFGSLDEFESVCQLGNWVSGQFTKPYLIKQLELEYSLMLSNQHGLHVIPSPINILTRIRHFREDNVNTHLPYRRYCSLPPRDEEEEEEKETFPVIMVKVPVHFKPENVKKVKRRVSKCKSGMMANTVWGNVYIDMNVYTKNNFEGRHLALWVSCLPQRITNLSHENCYWHFVGELKADPFKPNL